MVSFTATAEQLEKLENVGILKFQGTSGAPATAELAIAAPNCTQAISSRGDTFDIEQGADGFKLTMVG